MMTVRACQDIFIPWIVEQSAKKISNSTLWPTLLVRQNISRHPMLRRKLCGYESSSMSSEWHPFLMAPSCCTTTVLVSLLKWRNRSHISGPSTFYAATTWSERSWIEMTSSFRRLTERRTWPTHLLKPSTSRSLKTTNQRWVYDIASIGFSPSRSCWKLCPKINCQSIDGCAYHCNYV